MKFLKRIALANRVFLVPYLLFLLAGTMLIITYSKPDLHILLNGLNCSVGDFFFKYFTHSGDGLAIAAFVLVLLFIKYKYALALAAVGISVSVVVQGLKRGIFKDFYRPKYYFENIYEGIYKLHIPEGVEPASMFSFPSGHTTTAFALFFFLCLIVNNKYLKIITFLFAVLASYSRVYLSFHFTEDIIAGSFLGVLLALGGYYFTTKLNKNWAEQSLTALFKK